MATSHASGKWKLYGGGAEVQPLPNSRYRVTIRCQEHNLSEDWYYANRANIFKSFGDAYDLPLEDGAGASDSWKPADGEEYPNLTLIDTGYGSSRDTALLTFVYETLTSTWTNEDNNLNPLSVNGLRVLEQTQVATSNTALPYNEDDIGVVTMVDGGKTLYLAGIDDESSEQIGKVTLRWAEAGTLSVSNRSMAEGVQAVETVFLAVEGATVGPVYARSTRDFEGLKTISVTNLQDNDGNSIVTGGENLVDRYERKVEFTYPGTIKLSCDTLEGTSVSVDPQVLNFELTPPVETKVDGTVSVIFQTSSDLAAGDETYDDGGGAADSYWNPTEWAKSYTSGIGWSFTAFSETQGLRGYRVDTDIAGIPSIGDEIGASESVVFQRNGATIFRTTGENNASGYLRAENDTTSGQLLARMNGVSDLNGYVFTVNGRRIYGKTPFIMQISGGPDDPSGTKYVLDIDIRPAFEDLEGNTYYKKTIVTATV